jgi:hypothetical protein
MADLMMLVVWVIILCTYGSQQQHHAVLHNIYISLLANLLVFLQIITYS